MNKLIFLSIIFSFLFILSCSTNDTSTTDNKTQETTTNKQVEANKQVQASSTNKVVDSTATPIGAKTKVTDKISPERLKELRKNPAHASNKKPSKTTPKERGARLADTYCACNKRNDEVSQKACKESMSDMYKKMIGRMQGTDASSFTQSYKNAIAKCQ